MSDHAVIVRFDYGQTNLSPLHELEDKLTDAIQSAAVGDFDGNEIAVDGSDGRFYMYGPNADRLFEVVRPLLAAATCIRNAVATIRYGPAEDAVKELEVAIGAS